MTSFSVAVAVEKQQRFFVDKLMLGVQLANISTRCCSHPQGKSEVRCKKNGNFIGVAPELACACTLGSVQRYVEALTQFMA